MNNYETLELTVIDHIANLVLNRPEKANALNEKAWEELKTAYEFIDSEETIRVVVLSGQGKHFCSGIDLSLLMSLTKKDETCEGQAREVLRKQILNLQSAVTSIETCTKPVIAAVSGACIGAGLDIISACDIRYASENSFFAIREIDLGMVADLGTMQRLPRLIPEGLMRELAFTGRQLTAPEALQSGLINGSFTSKEDLTSSVNQVAARIASNSPLAIRGSKHILNYSRDHSIADGLNYIATWNAGMLLSADLDEALKAAIDKRVAIFKN